VFFLAFITSLLFGNSHLDVPVSRFSEVFSTFDALLFNDGEFVFNYAHLTPAIFTFFGLIEKLTCSNFEHFFAKVTNLVDFLELISWLLVLVIGGEKLEIFWHFTVRLRVQQTKVLAEFVTLVSSEESQDTFILKVRRVIVCALIQGMDDRISQNILNSLDIDDDQITPGDLPRKVRQSLSYQSLVAV